MALEGLYVSVNATWYPAMRSELLSFPACRNDDAVDALGLVVQLLDQMLTGVKPQPAAAPLTQSRYAVARNEHHPEDWMVW